MANSTLTTTNIGVNELKHLKKLASQHGLRQSEFINSAILYFSKTGINPKEKIYSPREEIERLTKRTDEVIRFMQVHEKQKLSPLMERLIILEHQLRENYLKPDANPSDDKTYTDKVIKSLKATLELEMTKTSLGVNRMPQLIKEDINQLYVAQKKTMSLLKLIFELLKHSRYSAGVPETDIKNLENALSEIR